VELDQRHRAWGSQGLAPDQAYNPDALAGKLVQAAPAPDQVASGRELDLLPDSFKIS
jgi:hypothetical protein